MSRSFAYIPLVLFLSGLFPLLLRKTTRTVSHLAACGIVLSCAVGLIPAARVLATGQTLVWKTAWNVPYGSLWLELDALSAFFLIPILILSAVAAVYSVGYFAAGHDRDPGGAEGRVRIFWFFYALLAAGMALVVLARNAVLFLVAWEVMSLASFFLVTLENEKEETRSAGWTYLVATHLGTAFLFLLFLLLGRRSGSLDFETFARAGGTAAAPAGMLFLLAVVGFGTKAGLMPLHVWLPEAHPAAPSPVSALMSGVMIKTGVYGVLRALTWLGAPPAWWGQFLIVLAAITGIVGVVFALAQRDMKRLLAYSSVENMGVVFLGIGVGLVGAHAQNGALAGLGFAGALLHVFNHSLFKGLLFLGAGAVAQATGTRQMDRLGGLMKRMPKTGVAFVIGAAAIAGLPPLNGFVGEFLIYKGAYTGARMLEPGSSVFLMGAIGSLALIGGLAAACFAKAFGSMYLGEPRAEETARAREASSSMWATMMLLAAGCVAAGLGAPAVVRALQHPVALVVGMEGVASGSGVTDAAQGTIPIAAAFAGFGALALILALIRRGLLRGRALEETGTWDCGYARPTARMQYTSSSFTQPLILLFRGILRAATQLEPPRGHFPSSASFDSHTPDLLHSRVFGPSFRTLGRILRAARFLQEGRVQVYVLYIVVTLVAVLIWKLW